MTFIGKLLIFLNLIVGIGAAVYSTSVYANRPVWFTAIDGGVDKGNSPINFPQLTADIDAQGKAANLASAAWGTQLKSVQAAEELRAKRHVIMFGTLPNDTRPTANTKGLIGYARDGNLPDAKGGGFLHLSEDPATRLLELSPNLKDAATFKKNVVHGPDDQPLKGTETLLSQFTMDSAEAETQAFLSKSLRARQKVLGSQIIAVQTQVHKQREIRDNLVNEALHLADFEINATLNRETFKNRQKQLQDRLAPFRTMDKK